MKKLSVTLPRLAAALLIAGALLGCSTMRAGAVRTSSTAPYAVQTRDVQDVKFHAPANNTWYRVAQLTVPAGEWRLNYRCVAYSSRPKTDTGTIEAILTLSTKQDGVSDPDFTSISRVGGNLFRMAATFSGEKIVTLAEPTIYYLLISESSGGNWDSLQVLGASWTPTIIRAERIGYPDKRGQTARTNEIPCSVSTF
jgi:hypothetical protein